MRKVLKVLHSLAACGLIGGLGCYMILLAMAPQDTPAAYADLRQSIAAIGTYVLLPSVAIALVSGFVAMATHHPFLNKGWALIKAAMGIFMLKGVLTVIGAKADYAAVVSRKIASGESAPEVLEAALAQEWLALGVVMALSVANVVLGVWRPRFMPHQQTEAKTGTKTGAAPGVYAAPGDSERSRPAA